MATTVFAHKYYFGYTSIELNGKTDRLEVIHAYSTHDLEYALTAITNHQVNLEKTDGVETLRAYINDHFKITSSGEPVILSWIGMEMDHNLVTVYQESGEFDGEELTLVNSLLVGPFPSQVNLVDLKIKALKKSLEFDKGKNVFSIRLDQR